MIYLTFNDAPSGIYSGQVIDVCRFIAEKLQRRVRLVAFISIRGFWANRAKIKKQYSDSIVLPMFPKARNWRRNGVTLGLARLLTGERIIMARGPFAAALGLRLRQRGKIDHLIFDGRGAYVAELSEYQVIPDARVKAEIAGLEKAVVLGSDKRLAVSEALVNYWREQFGYAKEAHSVIPCTLNSGTRFAKPDAAAIEAGRKTLGFSADDIVIAYSGSAAGWQSLEQFGKLMLPLMEQEPRLKLLLLVKSLPADFLPAQRFPARVQQRWLEAEAVGEALQLCDHGWLLREQTVTNRVASPVKFAEYLAAGLKVLISENLGDSSAFVRKHEAGSVITNEQVPLPGTVSLEEKIRMQALAQNYFVKDSYLENYRSLLA